MCVLILFNRGFFLTIRITITGFATGCKGIFYIGHAKCRNIATLRFQ